jgi:hypothetical protein
VNRVARKEEVGEELMRRCVTEEIAKMLEAKGTMETPENWVRRVLGKE